MASREIKMTMDEWNLERERMEAEGAAVQARMDAAQAEADRVNELLPEKLRMDVSLGWGGTYNLRMRHRLTLEDVPGLVEELQFSKVPMTDDEREWLGAGSDEQGRGGAPGEGDEYHNNSLACP